MAQAGQSPRLIRFGAFEVDLNAGELRKQGLRVRLQEQPFQILAALLENPGEVVLREDLIGRLWPDGTVVDFDRGLNAGVTRLRQALSDSAETPRYVETVARRGYRFIGTIDAPGEPAISPPSASPPPVALSPRAWLLPSVTALLLIAGVIIWWSLHPAQSPSAGVAYPAVKLTSERGFERHPSFSPDGSQIAFEWDQASAVPHIFVKVTGTGDPVRLTSSSAAEYGPVWSRDGRYIAFLRAMNGEMMGVWVIPAVGGAERKIAEFTPSLWVMQHQLRRMDWMPDSRHLIVSGAESAGQRQRLFLVDTSSGEMTWLTPRGGGEAEEDLEPAVSPDGRTVAFSRGVLSISQNLHILPLTVAMQAAGEPRQLVNSGRCRSPFWTADGHEIVFIFGARLARIGLESGAVPREIAGLGEVETPVLSQTGRLAYSQNSQDRNIWRQEIPAPGAVAPPPQRLIASTENDQDGRYSPDGSGLCSSPTAAAASRFGLAAAMARIARKSPT